MRNLCCLIAMMLVVTLLASCVPVSIPSESIPPMTGQLQLDCTEVIDAKLEAFPFEDNRDAVLDWIRDQYNLTLDEIEIIPSADGSQYTLYWKIGQKYYDVTQWRDAKESALIWMKWSAQPPTLADVLRCLGGPLLYRAYLAPTPSGNWTYLELWYPERGIVVTSYVIRKVSSFTNRQIVARISYVRSGPPEDLITRLFLAVERGSARCTQILQGLKPWPGDITKITIDERGY